MKKFLIILASVFVLIIAAAIILPVVFKDDIKAAIDKELEASVNADVIFDVDNFSLSMFSNFPNFTATMNQLGVINRAPFEGEILFAVEKLEVEINLFSIFGDNPSIKGIFMEHPIINIKVLENGSANYDIAIASDETEEPSAEDETGGDFKFSIDHWQITRGEFTYDDATIPYYMKLTGVEHGGNGDFTLEEFDLRTFTSAQSVTVAYDGVTYLEGQTAKVDATISISEDYSRYTFKENKGLVNDFALSFDGWFFMADDYYDMDITYSTPDNSFKSLLSLVPGMYSESFADLETAGQLALEGMVKGKYSDTEMPAFSLKMGVSDAMFKYPDLPTAIENISMALSVDNPDGIIENTSIDLSRFHMDFGSNPIDAKLKLANLSTYEANASLSASLNLGELSSMFPVEGLDMKGNFRLEAEAKGSYDSTLKTMPLMQVSMSLRDGYIKSSDFPIPLEDLQFGSSISNGTGQMKDFTANIKDFTMNMDGERFTANLDFGNLDNYTWNAEVAGGIDLQKISRIFPLAGVEMAGKIAADIKSSGNYASFEAGKYEQLPTSGTLKVNNLLYRDSTLGYDVTITESTATLTPKSLSLESYQGNLGSSDIRMSGTVTNYMGFLLSDSELLRGTFDFRSGLLDLNELMPDYEETSTEETSGEESYSAIPVPKNIDFVLNSTISKIRYMDLELDNASGQIVLRDGIARLDDLKFNTLGGTFLMAGAYDTSNPDEPRYDLKFKIDNLSISESFKAFTIVQKFAPIAQNLVGNLSTDFAVSGDLGLDLMPKFETISGSGLLKVAQAAFGDEKFLSKLGAVTKVSSDDQVSLKDIAMSASISNGRLNVKPFDMKFGDYPATLSGSTGIDGSIDYNLKLSVPASKLGSDLTSLTSSLGLASVDENSTIPLNIGIGGSYKDPSFGLISSGGDQVKTAVADKARDEGTKLVQSLADSAGLGTQVGTLLAKDSTKIDSTKTVLKEEATEKAKEALKNLLKKKNN